MYRTHPQARSIYVLAGLLLGALFIVLGGLASQAQMPVRSPLHPYRVQTNSVRP